MRSILKLGAMATVVCVVNTLCLAIFLGALERTAAQGGDGSDCVAGDITGDGVADLGDAVTLLAYLYNDGPEPEVCAQVVEVEASGGTWPPATEDMVWVSGSFDFPFGGAGEVEVIYEVPEGQHFVMTSFLMKEPSAWVEVIDDNGEDTPPVKIPAPWLEDSATEKYRSSGNGIVFEHAVAISKILTFSSSSDVLVGGYLVDVEDD